MPFSRWVPYAVAACLMILGIGQTLETLSLRSELRTMQAAFLAENADAMRLRESNALVGLHLALLDARDASHAPSKIIVAWDPYRHGGVIATQDLPAPPAGHDYQLWVLDPAAEAPLDAGLLTGPRPFTVKPVSTPSPGFAISLEPGGGSPAPTGPILFAVAPGP